ncbi:MAG: transporter substrate-binding domain-containing protein [Clostridiales bacterium]|nr:transporter substrate-binding domain-containing protein [Clostridiales bacterium]
MKRIVYTLFGIILSAVLVVGCSGEELSTYENIIEKGNMTFAMSAQYPPFNFIDESGDVVGFDVDIAKALAAELGVEAEPITTDFDGIIAGLNGKRFDMIIGSMSITEERLKEVNFTDPYYYDGAQFFGRSDLGIGSIEELEDGAVGVVTGTTYLTALEEMDNVTEILQFSSDVDNIMAVEQGRADGLVTGKFMGREAPGRYGVDIVPIGSLLYVEEIAIAIRKEDTKLLEEINKALATIVENGVYEEISYNWFGENILEK